MASFAHDADENDGYRYLLVVIDIFSRYAWVEPIKDKTAKEVVRAFNKIISKGINLGDCILMQPKISHLEVFKNI